MADLNIDADRGFIPQCCTYRGLMDLVSLIDALLYFLRSIDALGVIPSHPEEIGSVRQSFRPRFSKLNPALPVHCRV
jgi:hypothetical protein